MADVSIRHCLNFIPCLCLYTVCNTRSTVPLCFVMYKGHISCLCIFLAFEQLNIYLSMASWNDQIVLHPLQGQPLTAFQVLCRMLSYNAYLQSAHWYPKMESSHSEKLANKQVLMKKHISHFRNCNHPTSFTLSKLLQHYYHFSKFGDIIIFNRKQNTCNTT